MRLDRLAKILVSSAANFICGAIASQRAIHSLHVLVDITETVLVLTFHR